MIRAAQEGDERAWSALHNRLRPLVRVLAHRRSGATDRDLDDLEAHIWWRLFVALPRFDPDTDLIAWAGTVTVNAVHNWRRGHRRFYRRHAAWPEPSEDQHPWEPPSPDRPDRSALVRIESERAMGQLEGRDAVAVQMTAEGWGGTEIAAVLGTTPGNARKVLLRARNKVRDR